MKIECEECEMFQSDHCRDCFVTAVLSRKQDNELTLDPEQETAVGFLQDAGLAPVLRFKRRAS